MGQGNNPYLISVFLIVSKIPCSFLRNSRKGKGLWRLCSQPELWQEVTALHWASLFFFFFLSVFLPCLEIEIILSQISNNELLFLRILCTGQGLICSSCRDSLKREHSADGSTGAWVHLGTPVLNWGSTGSSRIGAFNSVIRFFSWWPLLPQCLRANLVHEGKGFILKCLILIFFHYNLAFAFSFHR